MMKNIIILTIGVLLLFQAKANEKSEIYLEVPKTSTEKYPKGTLDGIDFSVTIIGSGNPQYNTERSGPSALVQFQGTKFLVDMGNGTRAQLEKLGFTKKESPDALLLTHHHLDHNEEFIPMMHQKLMSAREFLVAGPAPIKEMADYVVKFYHEDLNYRMSNKGKTFDENNIKSIVKELLGENSFTYRDVKISTIEVPHSIYTMAYRFDANGKSIVISGDLSYTENLSKIAKGADVLVLDCQIIRKGANKNRKTNTQKSGNKPGNGAHASLEDGAKMAAEAGVKTLIITHLSNAAIDVEATKAKIAEQFEGEVIIAEDFLTVSSDGKVFLLESAT